jgi:DNA processing protein
MVTQLEKLIALNNVTTGHVSMGRYATNFNSLAAFLTDFDFKKAVPRLASKIRSAIDNPDRQLNRKLKRDVAWLDNADCHLISLFDPEYPALLKQIYDPPLCLFAEGNVALLNQPQVAIVGSRRATSVGRKIATEFATKLSQVGLVITSGMATGIDAAGHHGALEQGTIAVLGTGCDRIYPARHERLMMRIKEKGLLISEYPLGREARSYQFPQRNRIVTGMSLGTLIVEAAEKSGTLISARLAMEQGREVFAVPGSIYGNQSFGCHKLIQQGAKLVQSIEDILEEFPLVRGDISTSILPTLPAADNVQLDSSEKAILALLSSMPMSLDELFEATSRPLSEISLLMLSMEMKGFVKLEPTGYVRSR